VLSEVFPQCRKCNYNSAKKRRKNEERREKNGERKLIPVVQKALAFSLNKKNGGIFQRNPQRTNTGKKRNQKKHESHGDERIKKGVGGRKGHQGGFIL